MSARPGASGLRGLHVLADDAPHWKLDPVEQAEAACRGGAAVVQLRAKRATDRSALAWCAEIRRLTREHGLLFVVNDRADLALAAAADGVHLGQEDLPPARLPGAVRAQLLVGRSTHSRDEARAAGAEPIDYVAFGPVYGTTSVDSPHEARGLGRLRDAAALVAPLPLVAIGGIGVPHCRELREAGAAGVAVISAVAGADDPVAATRALVAALSSASP